MASLIRFSFAPKNLPKSLKKTEQKDKIAHLKVKLINNGLKFIAEELQIDYSQFFNNKRLK